MEPKPPEIYTAAASEMQKNYQEALKRLADYRLEKIRQENLAFEADLQARKTSTSAMAAQTRQNTQAHMQNMANQNRQTQWAAEDRTRNLPWEDKMRDWQEQDRARQLDWSQQDRNISMEDRQRMMQLQDEQLNWARQDRRAMQDYNQSMKDWGWIGDAASIVGGGIGAAVGGPGGAMLGSQLGGGLGRMGMNIGIGPSPSGQMPTMGFNPQAIGNLAGMYMNQQAAQHGSQYNPFQWTQTQLPTTGPQAAQGSSGLPQNFDFQLKPGGFAGSSY